PGNRMIIRDTHDEAAFTLHQTFHIPSPSALITLENQRRIGATKSEGIGKHGIELSIVDALADDRHVCKSWIQFFDMCAFADEIILHHQERINGFLNARRTKRMASQGFGRRNRWASLTGAKNLANRF